MIEWLKKFFTPDPIEPIKGPKWTVVSVKYVNDISFGLSVPSVYYEAVDVWGEHKYMWKYGCTLTKESIESVINKGGLIGKEVR